MAKPKSNDNKVLLADLAISVHVQIGELTLPNGNVIPNTETVTILPGQFLPLSDLPDYVQKAALGGKIQGARVVDEYDAKIISEEAARVRGELVGSYDVSHSDYAVSDEERALNRVGLMEAEAGGTLHTLSDEQEKEFPVDEEVEEEVVEEVPVEEEEVTEEETTE